MSQVPQVPPGGPGRPQPSPEESKPLGRTSEKFTRLIKEVESTDAEKQGKRRERPKLEEEPEAAETEVSFAAEAEPSQTYSPSYIPASSSFFLPDEDALTGMGAPSSLGVGDELALPDDAAWAPAPSNVLPPPPAYSESSELESPSAATASVSRTTAARRRKASEQGQQTEASTQATSAKKQRAQSVELVMQQAGIAKPAATKKPAVTKRQAPKKVLSESTAAPEKKRKARAQLKATTKRAHKREEEIAPAEAPKKRTVKPKAVHEAGEPAAIKRAAAQRARRQKAAETEAAETMAPGLPYLAQAALHHVSTVPAAQGSKIEALSGRPLPTVASGGVNGVAAATSTTGTTLTRSAGLERVLAALKAAVLTLEQQSDKRTLTITLKGDPRLAGTALEGLKIRVEEFAAAPKQYNITMESSPEAQAMLSGAAADMVDQLNRLGRDRGWSVQRLDVQVGRPLFHRKEAGDMGGGAGGGRGGKTS